MGDGTSEEGYYFNGPPTIDHDGRLQKADVNEFDAMIKDVATLAKEYLRDKIIAIRESFPTKERR